jgi:hypothetical protein
MIINDFYLLRTVLAPGEAYTVLVVYSDAELAFPAA